MLITERSSGSNSAFSAALCRGLIEASCVPVTWIQATPGFPRLYAAASLKQVASRPASLRPVGFPRLYAAASLKLSRLPHTVRDDLRFPRLYAAASLKHFRPRPASLRRRRFPRLYAAASLKRPDPLHFYFACAKVFRGFMPRPH